MEDINCWILKFEDCLYSKKLLDRLLILNEHVKNKINILEVKKAIHYARKYHGSQMRQSGEPYYSHPIEVAYLTANHTSLKAPQYFRTDIIVTSLLHDCLEDTTLTYNNIADIFGERIANQVNDLTRIKADKKISAAETLDLLFPQKKKDLLHIKLFDRLHNTRTLEFMPSAKISKIASETLGYFVPLAIYLNMQDVENELIKLCYQYLPITSNSLKQQESSLALCIDDLLLASLISQNDANQ